MVTRTTCSGEIPDSDWWTVNLHVPMSILLTSITREVDKCANLLSNLVWAWSSLNQQQRWSLQHTLLCILVLATSACSPFAHPGVRGNFLLLLVTLPDRSGNASISLYNLYTVAPIMNSNIAQLYITTIFATTIHRFECVLIHSIFCAVEVV